MSFRSRVRAALSLKESPVGAGVSRPIAIVMAAIAVAVTAIDLGLIPGLDDYNYSWRRAAPGLLAIAAFAILMRRPAPLGVRAGPLPSVRYWLRATIGIAMVFAVIVTVSFAIYLAIHGWHWPASIPQPRLGYAELHRSLIDAPLLEELIYRWVLVTGLAALGARWRWVAVVASGAAFAYLHVRYHVPAANNLVAGFVFAWVYLRSGLIVMPVAYHALGNLAVAVLGAVGYHLLA